LSLASKPNSKHCPITFGIENKKDITFQVLQCHSQYKHFMSTIWSTI
jgi:hypothetical protein